MAPSAASPFRRWARRAAMGLLAMGLLALAVLLGPAAAAENQPAALHTVRLALQWQPQSQFAGFYLARDRGIYRSYGLDVELVHADAEHGSLDLLRSGKVDLATTFLSDGLIAAAEGDPASAPVQIAQLVQHSNLMLVAWKDMGIESAEDLDGKRVSLWQQSFSAMFDAFFAARGIHPVPIPQYASINLFLQHGVAACAAMRYNEYHRILQAGVDPGRLTTFAMQDEGFGVAEDGLYARADWLAQNPAIARAVRDATLAGWAYARDHPDEAVAVSLKEAQQGGVPANRPHERWMLQRLLESIFVAGPAAKAAGHLDRESFERAAHALHAAGLLPRVPAFARFAPLEQKASP